MLTGRAAPLLAFLAALVVVLVQIALARPDRLQPDEHTYLAIVERLVRDGVYTDGTHTLDGVAGKPGRFIAPALPMLMAAVAKADAGFAATLSCLARDQTLLRHACGSLWPFYVVQAVLAAAAVLSIFVMAGLLARSPVVPWLAAGVALASGELAGYVRLMLTDMLSTTAFLVALAALAALVVSGRSWLAALAGAGLGLAILARPSFAYLLYLIVLGVLAAALLRGRLGAPLRPWHALLLAAAALVVQVPWMLRNLLLFGDTALVAGYAPFTLVQRLSYNAMSWAEWGAAWIYWFPDVGDDIARALLPAGLTSRLGWNDPETFYQVGIGRMAQETLAAAGGAQHHLGYLLRVHLLGDLAKHIAVTLVLAWRALWVGKWLAVLALALLWPVARDIQRQGRLAPLLAILLPLAAMVGLHAFVSVSIARYNLPLIGIYAIVIAIVLGDIGQRLARRAPAARQRSTP